MSARRELILDLTPVQRARLEMVRADATMVNASFGLLWPDPADPLPTTEAEVTAFIQRRTAVWRDTWILGILDEMLAGVVAPPDVDR